jgi:hypothetical protein
VERGEQIDMRAALEHGVGHAASDLRAIIAGEKDRQRRLFPELAADQGARMDTAADAELKRPARRAAAPARPEKISAKPEQRGRQRAALDEQARQAAANDFRRAWGR